MAFAFHIKGTRQAVPAAAGPRPRWAAAVALTLVAGVACGAVVSPIDRADAQAPTGHRQPTAAAVGKVDPSAKNPAVDPADQAMERALNNICRGCSPPVAVASVPRYDVAGQCRATASTGADADRCRRDEEEARNNLTKQWTQFTTAARSNCVQTAAIGSRPSYVELSVCLKATSIAPTLPASQ